MRKIGGILALALAVLLLATGRFLVGLPLALIGLTLLGRNPLAGLWAAPQAAATGAKRFRTTLLDVQIDLVTGAVVGRVVAGRFARRTLGSLSPHEAAALWREARIKDPAGAQIMEAVLDRLDPRWRELQGGKAGAQPHVKGQITISEAYNVLGLSPGATRADIQHAHRELMKRFHPDQGGSNYLAAKINEAKDVLLARLPE